jgi:hypothetical protein
MTDALNYLHRMRVWLVITALLLAVIGYMAPQQLPVVGYKLALVTLAAVVAYQIDRTLFARAPHITAELLVHNQYLAGARLIARALVFVGAVLGMTLGI